jgi:hypothetical protein
MEEENLRWCNVIIWYLRLFAETRIRELAAERRVF